MQTRDQRHAETADMKGNRPFEKVAEITDVCQRTRGSIKILLFKAPMGVRQRNGRPAVLGSVVIGFAVQGGYLAD
jgi:hypothetical protein